MTSFWFALFVLLQGAAKEEAPKQEPAASSGLEFASGDWKMKVYGFIRTDLLYDDSHPNNTQTLSFIKSEDDSTALPSSIRAEENSEDLTLHARLTRIGLDVTGPAIAKLNGAKVLGKIEFDFYNNGLAGQSESRAAIRMRHAFVRLSWTDVFVLAGQTTDIISPIFPAVNADMVMWGAGNLGDRRPMFMVDYRPAIGSGHAIAQAEIGLTGADDNRDLDGNGIRDGEASGMPTLQGRLGYRGSHAWLEKKTWEIGVWGHRAEEQFETRPAGFTRDDFASTAFGADLVLPLHGMIELRGEVWQGKNVDDVRGAILQGLSSVDGGTEIESRGYWLELVAKTCDWYTLHVGRSRDNPVDSDLPAATAASSSPVDNLIYYVANRVTLGGGLTLGFDYLHWTTQWRGDIDDGTDNRFNFFAQWNF